MHIDAEKIKRLQCIVGFINLSDNFAKQTADRNLHHGFARHAPRFSVFAGIPIKLLT